LLSCWRIWRHRSRPKKNRLGTWGLANAPSKKAPSVTVDTYFGARYTYLDLKLDFDGVFKDRVNDVSENKSWVELLLGARTIWDLSERWTITLTGDIRGAAFRSDFAWDRGNGCNYGDNQKLMKI
jgi:hypothetical protein